MSALGKLETTVMFLKQIADPDDLIFATTSPGGRGYEIAQIIDNKARTLLHVADEKEATTVMNAMAMAAALYTRKRMLEEMRNER